jgi:phosphatidylinositol glycan class S
VVEDRDYSCHATYFAGFCRFAIYIPLFLPVGFPIVLSLLEAFKWLRGSKTKEKKE